MAGTTVGLVKAKQFNIGLETVKGTPVAATHQWLGPASISPDDKVEIPEYDYGILGDTVPEDTYISETGVTINLGDTPMSVEQLAYIYNASVKAALSSAGTTPFLLDNFAFPTAASSINDISTFTAEWTDGIQAYRSAYAFCTKFGIKGDENANGGTMQMNANLRAKKRATHTITADISPLANIKPLNIKNSTVKLDALGTAAGSGAAVSNWVKAFTLDVETGWVPDSAMGGTDTDFQRAIYNGAHKISGKIDCLMDSNSVTEIANARTPTGRVLQIIINGTGTRKATFNLPIAYTKDPDWGSADRNGLHLVTFEFRAGYSRTTTAQGISFPLNMSASTTIT